MNAMIFAAGLGTRLRPLTNDRPKALVEVAGKTLLEHNLLKLKATGTEHVVINVHHFGEQIIQFIDAHDGFGMDIKISDERNRLLDTGGGIRKALPLFSEVAPILIHNVDILSDIDLTQIYRNHLDHHLHDEFGATLAINQRKTSRYLMFDPNDQLCGWTNVTTGEVKGSVGEKYAFTGIQVVDPTLFEALGNQPVEAFPIIPFYVNNCQRHKIQGVDVTQNHWADAGTVERVQALEGAGWL